jgi:hypothetical protein
MMAMTPAVQAFKLDHVARAAEREEALRHKFAGLLRSHVTVAVFDEAQVEYDLAEGEAALLFSGHHPIIARLERMHQLPQFDGVEVWFVERPCCRRFNGVISGTPDRTPYRSFADALVAAEVDLTRP